MELRDVVGEVGVTTCKKLTMDVCPKTTLGKAW